MKSDGEDVSSRSQYSQIARQQPASDRRLRPRQTGGCSEHSFSAKTAKKVRQWLLHIRPEPPNNTASEAVFRHIRTSAQSKICTTLGSVHRLVSLPCDPTRSLKHYLQRVHRDLVRNPSLPTHNCARKFTIPIFNLRRQADHCQNPSLTRMYPHPSSFRPSTAK